MNRLLSRVISLYKDLSLPIKVSFWYFSCMLLNKGIAIVTVPLFTRILSTSEYGLVSVYNSWFALAGVFITFGLANSVFNVGLVKFSNDKNNFNASMIGLLIFSSSVFLLFSFFFIDIIHYIIQIESKYIYVMIIASFFTCLQSMWLLRKRMEYDYRSMTLLTLAGCLGQVFLSMVLVLILDDKAFGKILGSVLVVFLGGMYCFVNIVKKSHRFFERNYWLFALKYNIPMIPHFLAGIILNQVDRVMIQNMVGLKETGIYTVAYSGASVIVILNSALYASYSPWLLKRLKFQNYEGISKIVNSILVIYIIPLLLFIFFAPEVMLVLAPPDYYDGIYVIPPVVCSMFFILLFNIFAPVEHYSLKTKFLGLASIFAALSNIFLNYIFIGKFGYLAAGYTTLICYIIYSFAHWIYMKKCCKNITGVTLFDDKIIFLTSIVIVLISILSVPFYDYFFIRYACIFCLILLITYKRRSLIDLVIAIRKT